MKKRHFTLLSFAMLVTFCFQSALAQDTTRRSSAYKVADWSNEQLYRIKKNFKTITTLDTLQQSEYEQVKTKIKGGVAEIQQNCEDPLQPFAIIKDKNPRKGLRLNGSVGPYFPYCGSFGAKDNTFYMNPGGYFNIGADYFITKVFGLGGTFGYALAGVDTKRHQADMIALAQAGLYCQATAAQLERPFLEHPLRVLELECGQPGWRHRLCHHDASVGSHNGNQHDLCAVQASEVGTLVECLVSRLRSVERQEDSAIHGVRLRSLRILSYASIIVESYRRL